MVQNEIKMRKPKSREWNGNVYKLTVGEYDAGVGRSPVRLRVTRDGAETAEYSL